MRDRLRTSVRADRCVRAAVALLLFVSIAACSSNQSSPAPLDIEQILVATRAVRTARFTTISTLQIGAGLARRSSEASGAVDLVANTGWLRSTVIPNPFPPPGQTPVAVELETRTVEGRGFERVARAAGWRKVNGALGSFLQLGNEGPTFRDAMTEIFKPVRVWQAVGSAEIRGERTRHFSGLPRSEQSRPVEVWVDERGRLRRVVLTRQGVPPTNAVAVTVLEFYDFGIAVEVEAPA